MSDEWIQQTVKRIKQHDDEKARAEKYALLKDREIGVREFELFGELQKTIKEVVERLNQHFASKRLTVGHTPYDRIEIDTQSPNVSLTIRYDSDNRILKYFLYKPTGDQEGQADLELTKGEVHYVLDRKPFTAPRLAEDLLDRLVNALLESDRA